MSKVKQLIEGEELIYPVTHEQAVLDSDGKTLAYKMAKKADIEYVEDRIFEIKLESGYILVEYDPNTGDLLVSNKADNLVILDDYQMKEDIKLNTEDKTVIGAINEVNSDLGKTENTKYTTKNGVKEFSCKDGYVDNVVIEGETLVNLYYNNTSNNQFIYNKHGFKKNTKYTMFANVTLSEDAKCYIEEMDVWTRFIYFELKKGLNNICISFTISDSYTGKQLAIADSSSKITSVSNVIILEGDHTDKPISYFEGLKSVGQGDNIEVLSRCEEGNIFDGEIELGSLGSIGAPNVNPSCVRSKNFTPIKDNTLFNMWNDKGYGIYFYYYDSNKNFIKSGGEIPSNARYFKFRSIIGNVENDISVKYVISYTRADKYISPQIDKKQISTTLRSLPNGVKDTIEKRGNKYVKVQRCEEVTFTGIETITTSLVGNQVDTIAFKITNGSIEAVESRNVATTVCDRFPSKGKLLEEEDEEACFQGGAEAETPQNDIRIRILRSKLSEATIDGFRTWLQANPITVVYELATPQIIELPNFNPQTYEGDTTLLLNSGAIQGECEFEVTNSMGSEIEVLKDKVSSLDCDYVEDIEFQFLNGWIKGASEYHSAKMINGVAYINLLCSGGTNTAGTTICYIKDQKFIPKTNIPFIIGTNDGLYVNGFVRTTGNIEIDTVDIPPSVWISICVSYPIL